MAKDIQKRQNKVTHRYILEPYRSRNSRITCPNCGAKHSYARYIDVTTGETLDDKFGRCDRVEKCGAFNSPYGDDIKDKSLMIPTSKVLKKFVKVDDGIVSLIDSSRVVESLTFEDNFSKFLFSVFNPTDVAKVLSKFKVGESNKWGNATVFWQIDQEMDVRTGKIILYDKENGKRVKNPYPHITWEHTPDKELSITPDFKLKQCLFGEHLITDDVETYHIVEAEKTAVICSIQNPNLEWLAVGGLELISPERLVSLEGKKLVFYPDKGEKAYLKWQSKLQPLVDSGWNIIINRSLEKTDLEDGADLADLILTKIIK